jgi:phage terminase small subunit
LRNFSTSVVSRIHFGPANALSSGMGKRGPRRMPLALKKLRGTVEPSDRRRRPEPEAPGLLTAPPAYLSEAQRARFEEVLAQAPLHLLRQWDATVVAGFVIAESILAEATLARRAAGSGLLGKDAMGRTMIDNLVKTQLRALAALKPFIDMLGFSPSSRANLTIDDAAADDTERWVRVMAMAKGGGPPPTAAEKRKWERRMLRVRATLGKLNGGGGSDTLQ